MAVRQSLEARVLVLRRFYRVERRVPSYAEMLALFGFRSKNAVHRLVVRLEQAGYITRSAGGRLGFTRRLTGSIKILGLVQAGFPSPAEEELVDVLSLDEYLVRRPEATFMLTVSGDSMIDAGIQPGDLVLVEKGRNPKNNDIVVAQVDGEWTLKYYLKDRKGCVRLEPANKKYSTIVPKHSLTVGGVVRAVVRRYA
ncbi:MAG TPA: transcriptional repressor LexA [Kiritimatiellia bacterium]|nr:transcriptional repressor LexA [Kiritimatiellia bacterium]HMO99151.1 transcriptional repressor LexA [Kiritimatiellia bacterium]HMP95671.1 transcriptional repressor LexA [Kiritimatiellia bacterium]